MTPSLTRTGLLLVGVSASYILTGVLLTAWPLLALGMAQLAGLFVAWVLFVPTAAMLRRRHLELAWWVPAGESVGGALVADRPLTLHLLLRNRSPFSLIVPSMQIMTSSALQILDGKLQVLLPPGQEGTLKVRAVARAAGHWFFQGLLLQVTDRLGFFSLQLYYPNLLSIKVFPPLGAGREPITFRPRTGASHERVGLRLVRQRGLGSDLREIRDHIPGDPFKHMAWKATARTRKLMVREFESEILVTHWILLDISSTMRAGPPGRSKLDHSLSLGAAFARLALEAGDRVGLVTFDHRIHSQVKPGDGQPQLFRIVQRLMELHSIVDEDLTDLTDAELYAAVAEYLAYQEGLGVWIRGRSMPPVGHPLRESLVEGPQGELFDVEAMIRAVNRVLERRRAHSPPAWWGHIVASSPRLARLRLFCRLSGLEIPYRRLSPLLSKAQGMAEAIRRAGATRHSQLILLFTDLMEMEQTGDVLDALRLARRWGHSVVVVAPFGPAFLPAPADEQEQYAQDILSLHTRRQRQSVVHQIESLGIPVLSVTPRDVLPVVLRRLARLRPARAGRAVS